jgi:ATP-dependent Clp protease ATP-binding subunit ClpC
MLNKMEGFTRRARVTLSLAQKIAEELGHTMIDSGHLLLALATNEGSISQYVMQSVSLDTEQLKQYLRDTVTYKTKSEGSPIIGLGEDVAKTLEAAIDETRIMGDHFVGTEHLLLGVMRVSECQPILEYFALIPNNMRDQIHELRGNFAETESSNNIGCVEILLRLMFGKKKNDE